MNYPGAEPLPGSGSRSASLVRVAGRMRVDAWTAEVVTALHEQGIRPLLLKGATTVRWLYADKPWVRGHLDVDLLIRPEEYLAAEAVLRRMGFREPSDIDWLPPHARTWVRPSDHATVDLHRTLHCLESVAPAQVWHELSRDPEMCEIHGVSVAAPGIVARALHVVLHVHVGAPARSKAARDLGRAVVQVDGETWRAVAEMAARLGVAPEIGVRLRQSGHGELADELGLPHVGSLRDQLMLEIGRSRVPPRTILLCHLGSRGSYRAKARWIIEREFPSRRYMREQYPIAKWGGPGLVAAYGLRIGRHAAWLPTTTRDWIRFRRRAKGAAGR